MEKILQIAIDGNSGSGKSTMCRWLKEKYRLFFVDSGLVYNFITYLLLEQGKMIPEHIMENDIDFLCETILLGNGTLLYRNKVYTEDIVCTDNVQKKVSFFAKLPFLRQRVNRLILEAVDNQPAVVNGRDIGTVVLPQAPVKVYLQSSLEQRIEGWKKMLEHNDGYINSEKLNQLIYNATLRDREDSNRDIAPLICAEDALFIDTSRYSLTERRSMIEDRIKMYIGGEYTTPVLSILIPTYNRADVLRQCLDHLLALDNADVEFVVSDDDSTDDTESVVKSYSDKRISFYRNPRNAGASYNSHLCFLRAKGRYALLISDEDDLYLEKINELVECFRNEEDCSVYIAGGIRGENDIKYFPNKNYTDGFSALKELGYCTRYMTGIMFNTALYRQVIGAVSFQQAPKEFSVYSFMYAMAKLFFYGRVITSSEMIFQELRFTKTTMTNNDKNTPDIFYFEPLGRKSQIICSVRNLASLPLNAQQKKYMLYKIFFDSAQVAIRAFDKNYLPRYQQMIPEHYDTFLQHLEGMDAERVQHMLYLTMITTAEEEGICSRSDLEAAAREDSEIITLVKKQQPNVQQVLFNLGVLR